MKKVIHSVAIMLLSACMACNNSNVQNNSADTQAPAAAPTEAPPANQPEAVTLMSKSDCNACHSETAKVVGPSFKDIAAKYPKTPENIAKLTDEVIKGSSGVWGQVPMTPHTTSERGEIEKMVTYILSVK